MLLEPLATEAEAAGGLQEGVTPGRPDIRPLPVQWPGRPRGAGHYRDQGPACASCPSGLMSPYASLSLADCLCDAGRSSCWADGGSDLLRAGTYGTNGKCSSCPAHSTSRAGSTSIEDCFCLPGFGVRATGYSRQVTSPYQECEVIQEEMLLGATTGWSC
eukprot:764943-Hanusia_phi.AAC.1